MKKITVLLLLFAFLTGFAAELVKDGKASGVIVLAEKPTRIARFAAAELNAHIEKITGTALPVVTAPQAGKTNIYVGASKYTPGNKTFALEEYMIKVKGNDIFLLGHDEEDFRSFDYQKANTFPTQWQKKGTCYAVYDFLDRLGVRWYLPLNWELILSNRTRLRSKRWKSAGSPQWNTAVRSFTTSTRI